MRLPDYPAPGDPLRAIWGRQVVDYLRAITPQPSGSIRPNTGPGGTTFSGGARDSGGDTYDPSRMFDLVQLSSTEVGIRAGLWNRKRPDKNYRIDLGIDGGGTSHDPDDMITLSGFAASKTLEIYVGLDNRNPTTLTAGQAETPVEDYGNLRKILGAVETNEDGDITSLVQWRQGGPIEDFLAADHSWQFHRTGAAAGDLVAGAVYIGGVAKTVTSLPASLAAVTTTTKYWVAVDFSAATATWGSGATVPTNTATVEYFHVLTLTCADSKISAVLQPWPCDIRGLLNP